MDNVGIHGNINIFQCLIVRDFVCFCTINNFDTLLGRHLIFSSGFALGSRIYIRQVYAHYLCLRTIDVSQSALHIILIRLLHLERRLRER